MYPVIFPIIFFSFFTITLTLQNTVYSKHQHFIRYCLPEKKIKWHKFKKVTGFPYFRKCCDMKTSHRIYGIYAVVKIHILHVLDASFTLDLALILQNSNCWNRFKENLNGLYYSSMFYQWNLKNHYWHHFFRVMHPKTPKHLNAMLFIG